jgi:MOSC domain-containing protein YiiM
MTEFPILSLCSGAAVPFGPNGEPSAIGKAALSEAVMLTAGGLAGDEQGDRRYHGGTEKALHHYAFEHYQAWRQEMPQQAGHFMTAGAFGENLSTHGLTETNVHIGDVFTLGDAVLQVSQARQPCWKLSHRFGRADMALQVQTSLRTGWYYRVLQPGLIAPDDSLRLHERPHPDWPLIRLLTLFYRDTMDRDGLAAIAALASLSQGWRTLAQRRLTLGQVEDWALRLTVPDVVSALPPVG